MILAPRPPFRASERPQGPGIRGSSRNIAQRFPPDFGITEFSDYRVLRAAPRATVQRVPGKEFRTREFRGKPLLPAGFRCPLPSWNPSEALLYESLPCESPGWAARLANQPRASLHRDCHQGQFTAICCTSLHSGTQHNPFPQPQGLFIFSK